MVVLECTVEADGAYFTVYSVAVASATESGILQDCDNIYVVNNSYFVSCTAYDYSPYSDYSTFLRLDTTVCIQEYNNATFS